MVDNRALWIRLQHAVGFASNIDELLAAIESPQTLLSADDLYLRVIGMTEAQIRRLRKYPMENAEHIVRVCDINSWKIITPDCEDYPQLLKRIPDYPVVLYVKGSLDCLKDRLSIAIVGARNATANSIEIAQRLSASIARTGTVIISGGALGIDSAAHNGALYAGGKTVLVMGCGLDCRYLMDNEPLRRQVAENGAVISEFPPGISARPEHFPMRNRIISALSYGTVVIEAGEKSGSLITAGLAASQGRDVFAVPGDPISKAFTGAHRLIRDGATPVFSAADVLEGYAARFPDLINLDNVDRVLPPISELRRRFSEREQQKKSSPAFPAEIGRNDVYKSANTASTGGITEYGDGSSVNSGKASGATAKELSKESLYHNSFSPTRKSAPNHSEKKSAPNHSEKKSEPQPVARKPEPRPLPDGLSKLAGEIYLLLLDAPLHIDDIVRNAGVTAAEALSELTQLELFGMVTLKEGKKYYAV